MKLCESRTKRETSKRAKARVHPGYPPGGNVTHVDGLQCNGYIIIKL